MQPSKTATSCPLRGNTPMHSVHYLTALVLGTVLALCAGQQPIAAQQINGFQDSLNLKPGRAFLDAKSAATVTTSLTPKTAKPGETVTLSISLDIPKGMHIYSMDQSFAGASQVKFEAEEGVEPGGDFVTDHPPTVEFIKAFDQNVEKFKAGTVTFSRTYKVKSDADQVRIQGILNYQICDANTCRNLKSPFEEEIAVAVAGGDSPADNVPANETDLKPARGTDVASSKTDSDPRFTFSYKPKHNHALTTVKLIPTTAKPGDTVTLEIRVDLEKGWHTFTTTLPEGRAATATELEVEVHEGLIPIDAEFQADRRYQIRKAISAEKEVDQEVYEEQVIWSRKFQLNPQSSLSDVSLKGTFAFQVCDEAKCLPAKPVAFEFPAHVSRGAPEAINEGAVLPTQNIPKIGPSPRTTPQQIPPETAKSPAPTPDNDVTDLSDSDCIAVGGAGETDIRDKGLIYVLGAAFVFGLLALLTPCVFPMVPITVSFFLKQAERRNSSPLKLALVYSGSIILTFTFLGLVFSALFGATYINTLANGVWLNLFLGLVLLFFSLNLLGLFDIAVPSWLLTFTGNKESSGGYLGVFFMALTFTLTSFTCTFAFLGLILVWAANGQIWWPLAGLISFSTAFALPFFLLALFPSYLHKLPKSGGWMNRVKVVMGFIELAFMFKFLSVADIGWNGGPTILDYHIVMTAWMVLAAVTGLYLLGKIRLPHDSSTESVGVFSMVLSMLFLGLASYIGVGLFGQKTPEGLLGRQIDAFAPPQLEGGDGADGPYLVSKHDKQRYLLDFEAAKRLALREKKPLFVDFTGVNCINCRLMEDEVLAKEAIQKQMGSCIRVQLYCDVMPAKAVSDPAEASRLVDANNKLQEAWLGDASLPAYAVVSPDGKTILSKVAGRVPTEQFQAFMSCGIEKSKHLKQSDATLAAK